MTCIRQARLIYFCSVIACLQIAVSASAVLAAEQEQSIDALLVSGSGGLATWTQNYNEQLRSLLGPALSSNVTPEFLPLIDSSPEDRELIARSLALKHSNREIDLVIAVLIEANSFIHEYGDYFAPDATVLHVLPGPDIAESAGDRPDRAVLTSAINLATANTIELIPRLFPDMERIYVVGGVGEGDASYMSRFREVAANTESNLDFQYLTGLPPDDLVNELNSAPANSGVIMTIYDLDNTGQLQQTMSVTRLMVDNIDLPVFAMNDTQPPAGATGGNVTTTAAYARSTYELILRILADEIPTQPVTAGTEYMFNGQQLDRFDVSRSRLPDDSIVINDQPNLWRDYPGWIALGLGIIVAQLALIGLMLEARRRSRVAEEALRHTQKMEALGDLAGGIAHDFNNILMAIMANAELAKTTLNEPQKADSRLSNILSASNRAKGLISQILLFSRQAATQSFEETDLSPTLQESVDQIRAFLPRSCEVTLECDAELAPVRADTNQLHQAFMNICINAQHAMNNEGTIHVTARNVQIDYEQKIYGQHLPAGNYVAIKVSDTGKGIADKDLHHIFEPFYSTKPSGRGTGLGLALVYRIVRAHYGFIDVETRPGEGTTFTIYLTASSQPMSQLVGTQDTDTSAGRGQRIMLVDDDDMVLDATERILTRKGFRVDAFRSPLKALEAAKKNPRAWDLVFTDLSMPEMDGVRLVTQIRQLRPDVPVILYTGYLDAVESIEIENLRILSKPSRVDEIASVVNECLSVSESSY